MSQIKDKEKGIRGIPRTATAVRYSNRGYAYAETGQSGGEIGLVPLITAEERPDITIVPPGVVIFNTTENCLQISDKRLGIWRCITGGESPLGTPSSGVFGPGQITLDPSKSIVDNIDAINVALASCCSTATYASHLGTSDGSTNGILAEPAFSIGRVSSPTSQGSPFFTATWDNDSNRDVIKNISLNWNLEAGQSITDLQAGTISLKIYDGNTSLLFTETLNLNGSTTDQHSQPNGWVSVSSLVATGERVEGYLTNQLPLNTILANKSGYLKLEIKHTVSTNTYEQILEFFVDSKALPTILSQGIDLVSTPKKFLSGVGFATISGVTYPILNLHMTCSGAWDSTYRADILLVESNNYGISNFVVPYNSSDLTKAGVSPPVAPFYYNDDFNFSKDLSITDTTIASPDSNGNFPTVRFIVRNPFTSVNGGFIAPSPSILINTYSDVSSDTVERFLDENYRLKESSSGTLDMTSINGAGRGLDAWNSTDLLTSVSGLQVINGRLVYPRLDFSGALPITNPDYSGIASSAGDLKYIRRFRSPIGAGFTNGIFKIDGLTESDRINKNILVDIRVVGNHIIGDGTQGLGNEGTGWLSLNEDYNYATFFGDDGNGCFITTGGYSAPYFEFSLGSFSTVYAANQAIEVRITYKNPQALNKEIKGLEITNW